MTGHGIGGEAPHPAAVNGSEPDDYEPPDPDESAWYLSDFHEDRPDEERLRRRVTVRTTIRERITEEYE